MWNTNADGPEAMGVKAEDTKAGTVQGTVLSRDGSKVAVTIDNCDYVTIMETKTGKVLTRIPVSTV